MNGKIITIFVLALVFMPIIATTENGLQTNKVKQSFDKPIIKGPISGTIGKTYEYTISYVDQEGDDVFYNIHWGGECMITYMDGPYKSGEEVIFKHTWCGCGVSYRSGEFSIQAQAVD